MSYDVWMEVDLGGEEPARLDDLDWWNYTSNVAPMWCLAMPETEGLAGMAGMQAGEAAVVLARGIGCMETDPDAYRALNPANGWGDFDGQLTRLKDLLIAFRAQPRATVRVCS